MRVLVVENDDRVALALNRALRTHGYGTERVSGVAEALRAITQMDFAVALVDLGLNDGDGIEVIRELRDRPGTGVIAVTARGTEQDRVRGLRSGADDYLVKPFGSAELIARIEAVLRRVRVAQAVGPVDERRRHGELVIDRAEHRVSACGTDLGLTRKEFEILDLLARNAGRTITREHLLDQVWQTVWEGSARTLDTHMAALRGKLADRATIVTVRGVGYRLESDGE